MPSNEDASETASQAREYYCTGDSKQEGSIGSLPVLEPTVSNRRVAKLYRIRRALGLHGTAPVCQEHEEHLYGDLWWPRIRNTFREPFSEFLGTFILVLLGDGAVAQVVLSGGTAGGFPSINFGFGIGLMLGIYVAGDSGAFLNPAVTLTFCVFRGLPLRRFPIYLISQFLGGFAAAGVVYANYIPSIDKFAGPGVRTVPPASTATGQILCTYPLEFVPRLSQWFEQFLGSFILQFVIFALKDDHNAGAARGSANWFPLSLFFLLYGIGACFGWQTGYAINLARDLGPRLMAFAVGYEGSFSGGNYYWWIPIVGSFSGCFFAGWIYDVFIYTGPESPVNSPFLGLPYLVMPWRLAKYRWDNRPSEYPHPV